MGSSVALHWGAVAGMAGTPQTVGSVCWGPSASLARGQLAVSAGGPGGGYVNPQPQVWGWLERLQRSLVAQGQAKL